MLNKPVLASTTS